MTTLINSAQKAKCTKVGDVCCSTQHVTNPEPESVDAYFEDEPDNCEIYFAGAGTNFGSFSITQEEKDEHLTYE